MTEVEQTLFEGQVPFVDREKELTVLERLFEKTLAGNGSTAFVVGEAGVGKTRLVQQFKGYIEPRGGVA